MPAAPAVMFPSYQRYKLCTTFPTTMKGSIRLPSTTSPIQGSLRICQTIKTAVMQVHTAATRRSQAWFLRFRVISVEPSERCVLWPRVGFPSVGHLPALSTLIPLPVDSLTCYVCSVCVLYCSVRHNTGMAVAISTLHFSLVGRVVCVCRVLCVIFLVVFSTTARASCRRRRNSR